MQAASTHFSFLHERFFWVGVAGGGGGGVEVKLF